jgi:hypothetical protein
LATLHYAAAGVYGSTANFSLGATVACYFEPAADFYFTINFAIARSAKRHANYYFLARAHFLF